MAGPFPAHRGAVLFDSSDYKRHGEIIEVVIAWKLAIIDVVDSHYRFQRCTCGNVDLRIDGFTAQLTCNLVAKYYRIPKKDIHFCIPIETVITASQTGYEVLSSIGENKLHAVIIDSPVLSLFYRCELFINAAVSRQATIVYDASRYGSTPITLSERPPPAIILGISAFRFPTLMG